MNNLESMGTDVKQNNSGDYWNILMTTVSFSVSDEDIEKEIKPSWSGIFKGVLLGIIIIVTLFGNILVVTAVVKFHRLRTVTHSFVVSLAIADITVALLVMPYSLLYNVYGLWRFGWIFCYFWISCDVTCCTSSILHLCIISLDRYIAINHPLTYHSRMTQRRAYIFMGVAWGLSVAISFVPIYTGLFADRNLVELYTNGPNCSLQVNKVYAVISSMLSFYVPLVVTIIAYTKIFSIANHQAKEIKRMECSVRRVDNDIRKRLRKRSKRVAKEAKAIKTLGFIMGLFIFCWTPFFLMYLIMPFCEGCYLPPKAEAFITWLGYANSFINPIIYAFLQRDFRLAFQKLLCCSECCQKRFLTGETTGGHRLIVTQREAVDGVQEYVIDERRSSSVGFGSGAPKELALQRTVRFPSTSSYCNDKHGVVL